MSEQFITIPNILLLQPEAGIRKTNYSTSESANWLRIDVRTLRKYYKLLQETDPPIMSTAITRKKNPETGLVVQERILNLEHYFNLIVCKLQQQDQAIEQNKKRTRHNRSKFFYFVCPK